MRIWKTTRMVAVIVMAVAFSFGGTVLADSFFKQAVHTDAFEMMGQKSPEKNDTTIMWLTEGKAYSQTGNEPAIIFDAEKGVMFMVNNERKEYSVIHMDLFGGDTKDESETDEKAQMKKMAQGMMGSTEVTVTPTDEGKKIGDWKTTKYNVDMSIAMMKSKQELWATEDIKVDNDMFNAVSSGMMVQIPGFDKIIKEMKKVKGLPVMSITRTSAMGNEIVTKTTLIEYSEKDAPDGVFDIPKDYKKVEMGMGGH